jgi:hypothetical protein
MVVGKGAQAVVDRGEADVLALFPQACMQLLRREKAVAGLKGLEHHDTLLRCSGFWGSLRAHNKL